MANSNRLVVEVVGDTSRLKRDLQGAESQIQRFSSRTSTIKSTGADAMLAQVRGLRAKLDELETRAREVDRQTSQLGSSLSRTGATALGVGIAVNVLGRNMENLGGTVGQVGSALSQLTTGNFVGFVQELQKTTFNLKGLQVQLLASGDAASATALANKASAAGFNDLAAAANLAAAGIRATTDAFVDSSKIRDSTSPGAVAAQVSGIASPDPKTRAGVSASQRNTWFDSDISRQLDRVQDLGLRGQVTRLKEIGGLIQARIDATKDITRKLRLEDELAAVNRQRKSVISQIADNEAAAAKKIRDRANQQKQSLLDAAAAIREGVKGFADSLKDAAGEGGPLTATTQLNADRILGGVGLGRDAERLLRARLSHFNSAGSALAGAGSGSSRIDNHITVEIDGKPVATSVSKRQSRARKLNPSQRNGPNAGR